MENGIVIEGVKHIPVKDNVNDKAEDGCKDCSLLHLSMCCYNLIINKIKICVFRINKDLGY